MNNDEIDAIIARQESKIRIGILSTPILGWLFSASAIGYSLVSGFAEFFFFVGASLSALSVYAIYDSYKKWKQHHAQRALMNWKTLGQNHRFGTNLSLATRQLGTDIQKVYASDPMGKIFPLRQSIRLIDTHNRQQQRLQIVENRLRELRNLQENLASKMTQLRELGEDYPQGARNLEQINGDLSALGKVHSQILASCARLEAIVIGVQKAAQSRELRRELEGLSARVAPSNGAVEPAFAAESLEDIERQIGCEIETYLQLERETDEHLR